MQARAILALAKKILISPKINSIDVDGRKYFLLTGKWTLKESVVPHVNNVKPSFLCMFP